MVFSYLISSKFLDMPFTLISTTFSYLTFNNFLGMFAIINSK